MSFCSWSFWPMVILSFSFFHLVFLWSLSPLTIFSLVIGVKCRYIWGYFSYYHRPFWQNEAQVFKNVAAFNRIKRKLQNIDIFIFLIFKRVISLFYVTVFLVISYNGKLFMSHLVILSLVILSFCPSVFLSFCLPLIIFSSNHFSFGYQS